MMFFRFKTLIDNLLQNTDGIRSHITTSTYAMSATMFGKTLSRTMPKAQGICTNIVKQVCDLLIDPEVVGEKLENIDLTYREEVNENMDRVFSDFGTADLMRKAEAEVHRRYGTDVITICCMLNMDKTHASRLGDVQVWPCNVAVANLKSKVLTTRKGSKLVGYGPMLPMTDKSFAPFLASVGITGTSRQNDACKILRRKLEQDYLRDVIRPVKDLEIVDPIVVQIGYGLHAIIRKVVFKIVRYLCKIVHVSNVKI